MPPHDPREPHANLVTNRAQEIEPELLPAGTATSTGPVARAKVRKQQLVAVFGVGHSTLPTLRFGHYTPGNRVDRTELFTVRGTANAQNVAPSVQGDLSFDPGSAAFGLYGQWPSMSTINSTASAPAARASNSWYSSTMKSLRWSGRLTAPRTAVRCSSAPSKKRS